MFTDDDNNLARYSLDDFFKLNMYQGDIYKVKNLRNLMLAEIYPDPADLKHAQDSIEERLHRFDKDLWAPSRQELQAQAECKRRAEAEMRGEELEEESTQEVAADNKKEKTRTTKRGNNNDQKQQTKKKPAAKPKQPKSTNQNASRSVRNRKR